MRSDDAGYNPPLTPDAGPARRPETVVPAAAPNTANAHDFVFDREDGDIELQLNNTVFKTRKYLLNKFGVLANLLRDAESNRRSSTNGPTAVQRVTVKCDAQLIGDFNNTTKILYASVVEGPFEFDTPTLISALRVATVYRYGALRTFCISKLEKAELSAFQRIRIAQELNIGHWTEPAFEELANRVEPVQPDEARILGIDALLRIANLREERKARRGDGGSTAGPNTNAMAGCVPQTRANARPTNDGDDGESDVDEDTVYCLPDPDDLLGEASRTCFIGTPMPAQRVHVPKKSRRPRVEVAFPDCTCTNPQTGECATCRLPPCLFKALRALQTQQMIHNDELMTFQATINSLGGLEGKPF